MVFNLSEPERKTLENDIIARYSRWETLDDTAKLNLYGGEYAPWTDGFLQNKVPQVEGYYCFYNKQSDEYEFPDGEQYSYNYIVAVYSKETGTLYIYGLDT